MKNKFSELSIIYKTDFYKLFHHNQYPDKTTKVYTVLTARTSEYKDINYTIFFGISYFIQKYLIDEFRRTFFSKPKDKALKELKEFVQDSMNLQNYDISHFQKLHDLGYLPLKICALPEGLKVPIKTPLVTFENTHPDFFWLTNYIEPIFLCTIWKMITSATIAFAIKERLLKYAHLTGGDLLFVDFQVSDFSFRGQAGYQSSVISGSGHILSFKQSSTIPAIKFLESYYEASFEKEFIAGCVPATEHSVMQSYGKAKEFYCYEKLITKIYPTGLISIVSDTWNLFYVLQNIILPLKEKILKRNGKVIIRPDSGNPVEILFGNKKATNFCEKIGVIPFLYKHFPGTVNLQGFKVLNSHIGVIWGDSLNVEKMTNILMAMKKHKFSSTNIVFGMGGGTYQKIHRDTFGMNIKATYAIIDGKELNICKNPITAANNFKKSLCGKVFVYKENNNVKHFDSQGENVQITKKFKNLLQPVFIDGKQYAKPTFTNIRKFLNSQHTSPKG